MTANQIVISSISYLVIIVFVPFFGAMLFKKMIPKFRDNLAIVKILICLSAFLQVVLWSLTGFINIVVMLLVFAISPLTCRLFVKFGISFIEKKSQPAVGPYLDNARRVRQSLIPKRLMFNVRKIQ